MSKESSKMLHSDKEDKLEPSEVIINSLLDAVETYFKRMVHLVHDRFNTLVDVLDIQNELEVEREAKVMQIKKNELTEKIFKKDKESVKIEFYEKLTNTCRVADQFQRSICKLVDYGSLIDHVKDEVNKLDDFVKILQYKINEARALKAEREETRCQRIRRRRRTDFDSDTEIFFRSETPHPAGLTRTNVRTYLEEESDSDEEREETQPRLKRSQSDTSLNHVVLGIQLEDMIKLSTNHDHRSDDHGDEESERAPFSPLSSQTSLDHWSNIDMLSSDDESYQRINHHTKYSSSSPEKHNSKLSEMLTLIERAKMLASLSSTRIYAGMCVLALSDESKHKWKLGHLVDISQPYNNDIPLSDYVKSCEYTVAFDDDEDDFEQNSVASMSVPTKSQLRDRVSSTSSTCLSVFSCSSSTSIGTSLKSSSSEPVFTDYSGNDENDENADTTLSSKTSRASQQRKKKLKKRQVKRKINFRQPEYAYSPSVLQEIEANTNSPKPQLKSTLGRKLDAKSIAFVAHFRDIWSELYYDECSDKLVFPVRARVVSMMMLTLYDDSLDKTLNCDEGADQTKEPIHKDEYMCSGTVIEVASVSNSNRYLVLFDNGYVRYIKPELLFPIFDQTLPSQDKIGADHYHFVQNYFNKYPERAMVRLTPGNRLLFYFNGEWTICRVLAVDSSLAQVEVKTTMFSKRLFTAHSPSRSHTLHSISFWIYRGSLSISRLYEDIIREIKNKASTELTEYDQYLIKRTKELFVLNTSISPVFSSSLFPHKEPELSAEASLKLNQRSQGRLGLKNLQSHIQENMVQFKPHTCSNTCVLRAESEFTVEKVKFMNLLLVPIQYGWQRHICHANKKNVFNGSQNKYISYIAPCGRSIRSINQIDVYLTTTNSKLTIDMFSYDQPVQACRIFEANAHFLNIADISNGREARPISCVNNVDEEKPDEYEYSADRIPLRNVPLDVSGKTCDGCDCKDNCRDQSKCACWLKTFEAHLLDPQNSVDVSIGYKHRRLYKHVPGGIFECNQNCKCNSSCSNRVVQNKVGVRLQLFKTEQKGWGLRCLDDVARGAFICTYMGHLMTEEDAEQLPDDKYFAQLDYIDIMRSKSGFKSRSNENSLTESSSQRENVNSLTLKTEKLEIETKSRRPKRRPTTEEDQKSDSSSKAIEWIVIDSDDEPFNFLNKIKKSSCSGSNNTLKSQVEQMLKKKPYFRSPSVQAKLIQTFEKGTLYVMDAKLSGNIGRYFNHSCSPNLTVQNVFVDTHDLHFPWITFFAKVPLKAGTELCWDYNYTIGSVSGKNITCHCGASNCRGRLL